MKVGSPLSSSLSRRGRTQGTLIASVLCIVLVAAVGAWAARRYAIAYFDEPASSCTSLGLSGQSGPVGVPSSWSSWVEQLGSIAVAEIPSQPGDGAIARARFPNADPDSPTSAVCRIEFTADGNFDGGPAVASGDQAIVVLFEKDINVYGGRTGPWHGYGVGVLDPANSELLAYVERS